MSAADYAETLERFTDAFRRAHNAGLIYRRSPEPEYAEITELVEKIREQSAVLDLPRAAGLQPLPPGEAPEELEIPSGLKKKKWRLVILGVADPLMRQQVIPFRFEELVRDGWVTRPVCPIILEQHWAFEFTWAVKQWVRDLKNPPPPGGIRDVAYGSCAWREHVAEERMKELALATWRFWRGGRMGPLTRKDDAKWKGIVGEIESKYRDVRITPRYLAGAIQSYMDFQLDTITGDKRPAGFRVSRPKPVEGQLRNIAASVQHFFREARDLELEDAPDMPESDAMGPRAAYGLLEKLRKACVRRMKSESDTQTKMGSGAGNGMPHREQHEVRLEPGQPMSKLARRLKMSEEKAKIFLQRYDLRKEGPQEWTVRLDMMSKELRDKIDPPTEQQKKK